MKNYCLGISNSRFCILAILMAMFVGPLFADVSNAGDLEQIQKARKLFSAGDLDASYKEYDKVKRNSDFWLEALEEKAQIKGRKGQYDQVLALLKTPTEAVFKGVVGPEPFFVLALTHLKICDYSSVFKDSKLFKERFTERLTDLENLKALNSTGVAVIDQVVTKKEKLSALSLGPLVKKLPRNIHRNKSFQELMGKNSAASAKKKIKELVQNLARKEIQEIESIVNRLHIVEAEATQRLHVLEMGSEGRDRLSHIKGDEYDLKFPVTDEVWVDELGHFAASVEKCPNLKRRAGL